MATKRKSQPVRTGIPTRYKNVMFRSRLEARWACFFDLLGWEWIYEPFDLNGYIPDFSFRNWRGSLIVEVKPETSFDSLKQYAAKAFASGWRDELLIVGTTLFQNGFDGTYPIIGMLYEKHFGPSAGLLSECINGHVRLLSQDLSYHCRLCGNYDGDHFGPPKKDAFELFAESGNVVQWKGPQQ